MPTAESLGGRKYRYRCEACQRLENRQARARRAVKKVAHREDMKLTKVIVHFSPRERIFTFEITTQEGQYSEEPLHVWADARGAFLTAGKILKLAATSLWSKRE